MTLVANAEGRGSPGARRVAGTVATALLALALLTGVATDPRSAPGQPPQRLADTGLYADFERLDIDSAHLAFSPQYPLWTDGAAKRRWISLPPGTAIDGSDPDAWVFPVGTRVWKEFSFDGKRVETRYIERLADGEWLFAAYAWSADGREARLAPERGLRAAHPLRDGRAHGIPGVNDCKACHRGGPTPVLGFSALQLSPDRDPLAPHREAQPDPGIDLDALIARGLLVNHPASRRQAPPRIEAESPVERAALGYLHANCGHCHNARGPLQNVGLYLRDVSGAPMMPAIATTVGHPVKKAAPGQSPEATLRIAAGDPDRSALVERIGSRYPALQMPPLGTELVDAEALALLRRWITEMERPTQDARIAEADPLGTMAHDQQRGE